MSFVTANATGAPPDPVGDVGIDYYVQMVNSAFAIYDKSDGSIVVGPTNINQLWIDAGASHSNICRSHNDGDPIVLYDQLAGRWLLTQFALGEGASASAMCIAVSQTSDPTGSYWLYTLSTPYWPDYPKFAVWRDAYYVGTNEDPGYTAYALQRDSMLVGAAATVIQRRPGADNFMMPADADGSMAPDTSSPGVFYTFATDSTVGPTAADSLVIYEFAVDWQTPANSTMQRVQSIGVTTYNYWVCGWFVLDCIPQPGTSDGLDPISEWPMQRLQYRNFGTHESLVGNYTIDAFGTMRAGIRWFELQRATPASAWTLNQEGTYADNSTSDHYWMGSIAMDGDGNVGLGFSVSSSSTYPSLHIATRLAGDAPGTLGGAATLIDGTGSQLMTYNRWGDYSSMSVDPVNDSTFWFTGEYYTTTAQFDWHTRIGAFTIEPEPAVTDVNAAVFLQGAYESGGVMDTSLAVAGYVPTTQPFSGAPWNYSGTESVDAVSTSVVDWVLMSLVSGDPLSPPMTVEARRAALLLSDGTVVDTSGTDPVTFDVAPDSVYYLVIQSRNHLAVMSSDTLQVTAGVADWDFRSNASQSYTAGPPPLTSLGDGNFGLFACDINADSEITAADFNDWLVDTKAGVMGYAATDCSYDGQVTAEDFNTWLVNTKLGAASQVP